MQAKIKKNKKREAPFSFQLQIWNKYLQLLCSNSMVEPCIGDRQKLLEFKL